MLPSRPSQRIFARIGSSFSRSFGTNHHVTEPLSNVQRERKSFGSFHSEDIETLVRQSDADFRIPDAFHEIHERSVTHFLSQHTNIGYGGDAKRRLFCVDGEWTFLNHGAFGAVLRPALEQASLWREHCERQPLRFFDRELFPLLAHSLRYMARRVLRCPAEELLPLPNVTSGLNAVFHSIAMFLTEEDEVLYLSLTYGSTKKMIRDLCARTGAAAVNVPLPLPVSGEEEVIDTIAKHISKRSKVIVLDVITSNTAMSLPIERIAQRCKEINPDIIVIVDGAHSLFSRDISLYSNREGESSLSDSIDFFLTNAHKWFSAPKGAALLWVSPSVQRLRPAILSHGFQASSHVLERGRECYIERGKYLSAFAWDGCRDYAALLSLPSIAIFWDQYCSQVDKISGQQQDGSKGPRAYMRDLLDHSEQVCSDLWRLTEKDFVSPKSMRYSSPMRLIPLAKTVQGINTRQATDKEAFFLQEFLHHQHKIEVPIKCLEGRLYVRVSAHIHNEKGEYDKLAIILRK